MSARWQILSMDEEVLTMINNKQAHTLGPRQHLVTYNLLSVVR